MHIVASKRCNAHFFKWRHFYYFTYRDDFDLAKVSQRLTLVDHNELPEADAGLEDKVSHIIDHHVRTRPDSSRY